MIQTFSESQIDTLSPNESPTRGVQRQAKHGGVRHQLILSGIDELQSRLRDIVRLGFIQLPQSISGLFSHMARRMIDAKATGLASRLEKIRGISTEAEDWQGRLLREISMLYLLMEAYKHIDQYDDLWQTEICTLVGYPQNQADALATPAIDDDWYVIYGRDRGLNSKITMTQVWFVGMQTGRIAQVVQFDQEWDKSEKKYDWRLGQLYRGSMYYYPSVTPMRVLPGELSLIERRSEGGVVGLSLRNAIAKYRTIIQENPFAENVPLIVSGVCLRRDAHQWWLTDEQAGERILLSSKRIKKILQVLAKTGGGASTLLLWANPESWSVARYLNP